MAEPLLAVLAPVGDLAGRPVLALLAELAALPGVIDADDADAGDLVSDELLLTVDQARAIVDDPNYPRTAETYDTRVRARRRLWLAAEREAELAFTLADGAAAPPPPPERRP